MSRIILSITLNFSCSSYTVWHGIVPMQKNKNEWVPWVATETGVSASLKTWARPAETVFPQPYSMILHLYIRLILLYHIYIYIYIYIVLIYIYTYVYIYIYIIIYGLLISIQLYSPTYFQHFPSAALTALAICSVMSSQTWQGAAGAADFADIY